MNELLKKIPKNLYIYIFYIFIFILFLGGLNFFYGGNYNNKKALNSTFSHINSINDSLYSSVNNNSIDIKKASSLVAEGLSQLNTLKDDLITIDDSLLKNPNIKKDLDIALEDTIFLYNYLSDSLSSPKDIVNNENLDNFYNLVENCTSSYEKVSSYSNKEIKFSKDSIIFLNNYYSYLNTLIKTNRDTDFLSKQNREFIIKLEDFKTSMDDLNKDFSLAINKVREDKRDLSVIIDDLYLKEDLFEGLKEKAFSLSIPDGYLNSYNYLLDYINYYEIYISTIKNAVIYEKTCSDIEKYSKEISKNYKNAYSKRDDVLTSYEDFVLTIKNN